MYKTPKNHFAITFLLLLNAINIMLLQATQSTQDLPTRLDNHKYPGVYMSLLEFMEQIVRIHPITSKTDRQQLLIYLKKERFNWNGYQQEWFNFKEWYGYMPDNMLVDGSKLMKDFKIYQENLWNDEKSSRASLSFISFSKQHNTYLTAYLKLMSTYQTQRRYPLIAFQPVINHPTYGDYHKKTLLEGFIRQINLLIPYSVESMIENMITTSTKFNLMHSPVELITGAQENFQVLERIDTFEHDEWDSPPYKEKSIQKIFKEAYPELKEAKPPKGISTSSWIAGKSVSNANSIFFGVYAHHINPQNCYFPPKKRNRITYKKFIDMDSPFKENGIYKFSIGIWKTQSPEQFDDYTIRDLAWIHNINIFLESASTNSSTLSSEPYIVQLNDTYYALINNRRQHSQCDLYLLSNNNKPEHLSSFSSQSPYRSMHSLVSGGKLYTFNSTLKGSIFCDQFNFSEPSSNPYKGRQWLYSCQKSYALKVDQIHIPPQSKKIWFTSNQTGVRYVNFLTLQHAHLLNNKGPFDGLVASNNWIVTHTKDNHLLYAADLRQQEKIFKSNALSPYQEFNNCAWTLYTACNPHYVLIKASPKESSKNLYENTVAFKQSFYGSENTSFIAIIDFRRPDKPLYACKHSRTPFFCPKTGILVNSIGSNISLETNHFKFL